MQPIQGRSTLEKECITIVNDSGLSVEYEPIKFILKNKAKFPNLCMKWSKTKKCFTNTRNVRELSIIPDLIIEGKYIVEVKGWNRKSMESFNIKWKLLKHFIIDNKLDYHLFIVTSKKQMKMVIEIIKDYVKQERNQKNR